MPSLLSRFLRFVFGCSDDLEIDKLRDELLAREEQLEQLEQTLRLEIAESERRQETLTDKEYELGEARERCTTVTKENIDLRNQLCAISTEIKKLKQQLKLSKSEHVKDKSSLEDKLQCQVRGKNELNSKVLELVGERTKLEEHVKATDKTIQHYEHTLNQLKIDIDTVSHKLEEQKQERHTLDSENIDLKKQLNNVTKELQKMKELVKWEKIINLIPSAAKIMHLTTEIRQLKSEIEALTGDLNQEKHKHQDTLLDASRKDQTIQTLEISLAEVRDNFKFLQKRYDVLQTECGKYRQENQRLSLDLKGKLVQLSDYERQLDELKSRLKMKECQVVTLREELQIIHFEEFDGAQSSTRGSQEDLLKTVLKTSEKLDRLMKKTIINDTDSATGDSIYY